MKAYASRLDADLSFWDAQCRRIILERNFPQGLPSGEVEKVLPSQKPDEDRDNRCCVFVDTPSALYSTCYSRELLEIVFGPTYLPPQ
jgi:hypothetical protein